MLKKDIETNGSFSHTKANTQTNKGLARLKITKRDLEIYSLIIVPLLLVFVFSYLPMFGIIIAFKNYKFNLGILGSNLNGLDNFAFLFLSDDFLSAVRNTITMNFLFIVFTLLAALTVAVLLFNLKSVLGTKIYQTAFITPHFLSWVVVAYMAYAVLHPTYGMLNTALVKLGIEGVDWYSTPNAWPVILTIVNVWKHVGMDSVIYYAALMGVDEALLEAAELDGANRFQKILYVMIPSIVPLIIMLTILKVGGIFRADFGLFYQLTRNIANLYPTTDVVDTFVFRSMRELGDMGMSAAAGLMQSVVGLVLVIITNRLSSYVSEEGKLF